MRQSSIDHVGGFGRPRKSGAGSAREVERLRVAGLSMSRVASAMVVSRSTLFRFLADRRRKAAS